MTDPILLSRIGCFLHQQRSSLEQPMLHRFIREKMRTEGSSRALPRSILVIAALVFSGCSGSEPAERPVGALELTASGYPSRPMIFLAPANPGGGEVQTPRQIQQVWTETGVLGMPVEVALLPVGHRDRRNVALMMSRRSRNSSRTGMPLTSLRTSSYTT
jgi:hypothetical protein